ncbi:cupin-like domain-containing protein [Novosphingobium sp.]|uniref:cupin-like domain-containing protein n=1 Tax=Novosphingobium sp. TaxID=1874826 RepID=UPI003B51B16B
MTGHSPATIDGASLRDPAQFYAEVVAGCRPVIIRGLVTQWPITRAATHSDQALSAYLDQFAATGDVEAFIGSPQIKGTYYYNDDLAGFNFERRTMQLRDAIAAILSPPAMGDDTIYIGSIPAEAYLTGFAQANPMPLLAPAIAPRLWLGHASTVSAHYDTLDNLACVVAGERRFTLFPPDTIGNLYVGPIDHTMAGQPVSLAASSGDAGAYPRFAHARERMLVADLAAGDALYLPKLWWHKVEATAPVNGLVNYWWDAFAAGPDSPYTALLLAMITMSERPLAERNAWRAFFDHYVFRQDGHPLAHLPPDKHGLLGPLRQNYGAIRARVMHLLRNLH